MSVINYKAVKVSPAKTKMTVKDYLRHESLKEVLTDVMTLKGGKIGEILVKFSEPKTKWVWKVKEGKLPKNINAETIPVPRGA